MAESEGAVNGHVISQSKSLGPPGAAIDETSITRVASITATTPTSIPRRPSLRRDISHELEFSARSSLSDVMETAKQQSRRQAGQEALEKTNAATSSSRAFLNRRVVGIFRSFVTRKPNAKKNSLAAPPLTEQQRQLFADDLLKRTHARRFLLGAKSIRDEEGRKQAPTIVVDDIDPTPVTPNMFQGRASSSNSSSSPILDLLAAQKEEEEPEEAEEASLVSANITGAETPREICSPSEIDVSVLEKEPELMAWRQEEDERERVKTMERRLNRARRLRRNTVMHYDQQEDTFRRRRAPQLFEIAVLIDLEPNDGSNEKLFPSEQYAYVPKISFVYPSKTPPNLQPLLDTLPPLCYADLGRARPQDPERYKDEQFLMIVTDTSGDRKYAYCHRFAPFDLSKYTSSENGQSRTGSEPAAASIGRNGTQQIDPSEHVLLQILCIVTPVNASAFYFDLTHEAALRAKGGDVKMLVTFLRQSFRHRLPPPNGVVTVKLVDDENTEDTEEPPEDAANGWEVVLVNRTTPKKGQGLGELLDRLGVDLLMKLFCALLCEKRVLLVADSVPILSRGVQAASTMLAPFDWPHTLIPIVPDPFLHLCYSPAPYLMGVLRDHLPSLCNLIQDDQADVENQEEYMLILDLDKGSVLKDKEWATHTPLGPIDLLISSPKLLPNRITQSLKRLLKTAAKSLEKREQKTTDAFQWTFVELVGHYRDHVKNSDVERPQFVRESFINSPSSRSQRSFLKWFVETGMFQVWINKKLDTWATNGGRPVIVDVFDKKLDQLKAAASDVRGWSWARF